MTLLNIWQNQRYLQKELNELKNKNRHFWKKKNMQTNLDSIIIETVNSLILLLIR